MQLVAPHAPVARSFTSSPLTSLLPRPLSGPLDACPSRPGNVSRPPQTVGVSVFRLAFVLAFSFCVLTGDLVPISMREPGFAYVLVTVSCALCALKGASAETNKEINNVDTVRASRSREMRVFDAVEVATF